LPEFVVRPIGVVRSDLKDPADAPKQGALTGQEAEIVVDPAFLAAMDGLERRVAPAGGAVLRRRAGPQPREDHRALLDALRGS
jgi:hypothetical protein